MYCGARARSVGDRLPAGLYGDRIFQCRHVTLPVNQRDASSPTERHPAPVERMLVLRRYSMLELTASVLRIQLCLIRFQAYLPTVTHCN